MRVTILAVLSITLSSSFAVTTAVQAQQGLSQRTPKSRPQPIPIPGQPVPSGVQKGGEDPILKELNLTAAQRTQIDQIKAKYRAKRLEARIAARKAEMKGQTELGRAGTGFRPIEVRELQLKQIAEMRSVLSESQRTALDQKLAAIKQQR